MAAASSSSLVHAGDLCLSGLWCTALLSQLTKAQQVRANKSSCGLPSHLELVASHMLVHGFRCSFSKTHGSRLSMPAVCRCQRRCARACRGTSSWRRSARASSASAAPTAANWWRTCRRRRRTARLACPPPSRYHPLSSKISCPAYQKSTMTVLVLCIPQAGAHLGLAGARQPGRTWLVCPITSGCWECKFASGPSVSPEVSHCMVGKADQSQAPQCNGAHRCSTAQLRNFRKDQQMRR